MQGIAVGELRLTGGLGIGKITKFSMREYPGEHARAELVGIAETQGSSTAELFGSIKNCSVELYAEGEERAIYSGIVQRAQSQEENGYRQLRLELGSGSLLMDMEKEKRTFQDISMTYGQVITRIASEAGMMAVYPRLLDETAIEFPVIQYRETDWEFMRRLASRFGMAVYPETTLGGGKLTVDLPQTGNAGELRCLSYTARIDRKFYQAGGEQEGRSREQYRTYEVRSMELRRVGAAVMWDGKNLFVCARKAELRDGMLEFVYILSGREWTWQKRLGNPKISGMSLLGTVEGCSGETVRLLLDIDRGRPAQLSYPWTWVPATGNLMYLMPQVGTRVSLYFKGEEETDAIAVNCIRSGNGCAQADYRDKSLTTEHGMQLRLNQGNMGIVSLKEKLLLDDMEGIRIAGSGSLHILAAGEVKITGSEVRVAGTGGVILYEGTAEADREGNIVVAPQGKIELSAEDGERAIHNRGKEVTYYLAWEHEDLSHPSNRYRDAPQQKDYDWMKLGTHVAAGLMIAGGIAALAAGGVLLLGGAAATAAKMAMTVFLAGSLYVGEQALSDIRSGRVSDLDQYTRKAVAGSVVGFLTGASGLLMAEASLLGVLALGFGEGLVGSIVTQKLLNEDGEIDWGVAIAEAGFSAVTAGVAWKEGRSVRGGERLPNTVTIRNIKRTIADNGISEKEFLALMRKSSVELKPYEATILENIRKNVPIPGEETLLQKVINPSYIDGYLDGSFMNFNDGKIGGCITTVHDVSELRNPKGLFEGLRLDYEGTPFSPADGSVTVIRFTSSEVSGIKIPFGEGMPNPTGGKVSLMTPPFTGNGFTSATNGQIIPEFYSDGLSINNGAQMIEITSKGKEILKAVYDEDLKKFVPVITN